MSTGTGTAIALKRGLPEANDAERFLLGWLMECDTNEPFVQACGVVDARDFDTQKHQVIFRAMKDLDSRGVRVERVHLAEALHADGKLESIGGLSELISMCDGIPRIPDISGYLRLIKEKSSLRSTIAAAQKILNDCLLGNGDSGEIISRGVGLLMGISGALDTARRWMTPGMVLEEAPTGLDGFICPPAGIGGVPLPWPSLRERMCGLQKGEMIVIAGRPSSGKSAMSLQIAQYAAAQGYEPAMVSLEVKKEAITKRLLSQMAMVDSHKMRAGFTSQDERAKIQRAARALVPLPFWIDDKRNQTAESIRQSLKRRQQEGKVDIILIDHFHLVQGGPREETRDKFSRIADAFQNMAGEFDCPIVVLAQLNRKCEEENRAPGLPDLKETGKLEENADSVLFVHRPETYAKNRDREEFRGLASFVIGKQRNGPTGNLPMVWLGMFQVFEERAGGEFTG